MESLIWTEYAEGQSIKELPTWYCTTVMSNLCLYSSYNMCLPYMDYGRNALDNIITGLSNGLSTYKRVLGVKRKANIALHCPKAKWMYA